MSEAYNMMRDLADLEGLPQPTTQHDAPMTRGKAELIAGLALAGMSLDGNPCAFLALACAANGAGWTEAELRAALDAANRRDKAELLRAVGHRLAHVDFRNAPDDHRRLYCWPRSR